MTDLPGYKNEDIEVTFAVPESFVPVFSVTVGMTPAIQVNGRDDVLPIAFAVATSQDRLARAAAAGASPVRLLVTLLRGVTQVFAEMAGKDSESDVHWEIRPEGS